MHHDTLDSKYIAIIRGRNQENELKDKQCREQPTYKDLCHRIHR